MTAPTNFLTASAAAKRLGVSVKALRIYEERGLIAPARTAAGWRAYGPEDLSRAAEIAALRGLGFSLAQVARVLDRDPQGLEQALADHQSALEGQLRQISGAVERVRSLRQDLAGGHPPSVDDLWRLTAPAKEPVVAFDLPWPWGGERFELRDLRALTYIVGPLFSGKTKLARRLAKTIPNAAFLGLDRLENGGAAAHAQMAADPALASRVERALAWLTEDGATPSDALLALLAGLEAEGPDALVIDMIEQGLDTSSQQALMAYLRRRGAQARPLFAMTRSCEILDLPSVGPHEAIILCPANHSPPLLVDPHPGAPGYEAVATCLAPPAVRARTAGVIAYRPPAA
ncbi:MerR family transcriptional regulator [Pelagibius sp.]|uniref:MerR family transcriptional regulator n=1 Tax=Pelagibius sp. TaxID=1931238 RepID=UPI002625D6B8|nr:MerR family transcriptional regulator [Pelagibius sp.]